MSDLRGNVLTTAPYPSGGEIDAAYTTMQLQSQSGHSASLASNQTIALRMRYEKLVAFVRAARCSSSLEALHLGDEHL